VKPAERLRVHEMELDEQAQCEVQQEQDRGDAKDRGRESRQVSRPSVGAALTSPVPQLP